ncbi:hypothetical protein OOK39_11765 [Streptomyces sp. NBC_00264]|uniref:hypothetical protein n=1 Tax=unclassified Streptomyces TaxID=2593676 RepID=UPI002257B6B8|nr:MULTISPECIES: hypothetical protein [unclassified Streptomyces]MCX5159950.1 hypothetical protein [Streptomyces sp. NBC_00305]MCX5218473.1 hypothetical protein [Streptomyces sp. NBC_00264]WSP49294.1 hypothetical protein OG348_27475 [Streptomyces sp. NBC_01243]
MRRAQALLDETQAERSRTLAAFAVTVGDDGSIADLMGLNEREVRLARRTVGRSDARSLAEQLLNRTPPAGDSAGPPAAAPEHPRPHPADETPAPPPDAPKHVPAQSPAVTVPPAPPQPPALATSMTLATATTTAMIPSPSPPAQVDNTVVWSPSMDSVLLWSWESGLDLQTVAAELGLEVRALLMRVQELANDGLLTLATPVADVGRSGRHRRHHEEGYAALFSPTATFPTHVPY